MTARTLSALKRWLLAWASTGAIASRLVSLMQRKRQTNVLIHSRKWKRPAVVSIIVPDNRATADDVAIAARLLAAYHRSRRKEPGQAGDDSNLWSTIWRQQSEFRAILIQDDPVALAAYLCNFSRHDAGRGIVQGDREYDRIVRDRSYRAFLALMAKDKLVSLAEALAALPAENPEQGPVGLSLYSDPDALVSEISVVCGCLLARLTSMAGCSNCGPLMASSASATSMPSTPPSLRADVVPAGSDRAGPDL